MSSPLRSFGLPGAERYARDLAAGGARVREDGPDWFGASLAGELEVQARWYAGELGDAWPLVGGGHVQVLDFGAWNREAGPDFTGVTLRFDSGETVRGDIEIDSDARDWERHGHADNPAFEGTALHVFLRAPEARFFTRTVSHREVPQVLLPSGASPARAAPAEFVVTSDLQRAAGVVRRAAAHRLECKARTLRRRARLCGEEEAWFQTFAVALGYKRNQIPFLLLAGRAGLNGAVGKAGESIVFGLAGFLESAVPKPGDPALARYLRKLWEGWWSVRASQERLILPASAWVFGGIRPQNHPHRRAGALAAAAKNWGAIAAAVREGDRARFLALLSELEHPFWSHRFNLAGDPLPRALALVGPQRSTDLLLNLFYPLAATSRPGAWDAFLRERGPTVERTIRTLAGRFFGQLAADPAFVRPAAHQQGLLQIAADFAQAHDPFAYVEALRRSALDTPAPMRDP